MSIWRYTPTPNRTASRTSWKLSVRSFCTQILTKYNNYHCYSNIPQLLSAEVVLCTHKTTIFCQFGNLEICPNIANPYLTQFSSISGGNCIRLTSLIVRLPSEPVKSKLYSTRTFDAITRSHRSHSLRRRRNST